MTATYSDDLRRLDDEETELLSRIEAAEKKTREMGAIMWRKNAEVRGLREEKWKRMGAGRNPEKYVFRTEAEVLTAVAEARNSRRIEDTKIRAIAARRTSGDQVRNVIKVYDEEISAGPGIGIDQMSVAAESVTLSGSVKSRASSSKSSKKSKGFPPRLLQKIGQRRRRDVQHEKARSR